MPDQLQTMLEAVRHVQHLIFAMSNRDREGRQENLAQLIAGAPDLKTMELCFGRCGDYIFEGSERVINLNELLKYRVYWPNLQRLVLQAFKTTENVFKMFLKRHAASLRSLELSHMRFT